MLLERLEAASHGDRLLTKLHVNVALFSTTASDIVEELLQLTRQQQIWSCGEELSLHSSLQESLQHHARPPVSLMKSLQWVYRVEEMAAPAALPARQCVLLFFSTMLAAAAALKWQKSPPPDWKRKGLKATDILRSVIARLPEVISSLRFLACLALLQHCSEPAVLGSKQIMSALMEVAGIKVSAGDQSCLWRHMDGPSTTALPVVPPRDHAGVTYRDSQPRTLVQKADASWDIFFSEARRRPTDAAVSLLQDLKDTGCGGDPVFLQGRGTPRGPNHFSPPLMPQAALDTWDDEVVFCPGGQDGVYIDDTHWDRKDFFCDTLEDSDGLQVVVPL